MGLVSIFRAIYEFTQPRDCTAHCQNSESVLISRLRTRLRNLKIAWDQYTCNLEIAQFLLNAQLNPGCRYRVSIVYKNVRKELLQTKKQENKVGSVHNIDTYLFITHVSCEKLCGVRFAYFVCNIVGSKVDGLQTLSIM